MTEAFDLIPTISIHPSAIVSYNQIIWNKPHSRSKYSGPTDEEENKTSESFLNSKRKAEGKVSVHAKRKLSRAIEYLVTTTHEKKVHEKLSGKIVVVRVAFITLTLPSKQMHDDKEIINTCLNSFMLEIKKYHNVKKYVWRAEKQKNGNIHFHIVADAFIPYWELRNRWNRIVNKLGYVDRFQQLHGHRTPNSTDIHSTRKIKNLKKYLTKYLTKNEDNLQESKRDINNQMADKQENEVSFKSQTGRIWSCSHDLSGVKGFTSEVDSELSNELQKVVNSKEVRKYEGTYFTYYEIDYHKFKELGADLLFGYFSNYLLEQFDYSEQLKAFT